jgi:hypothetical protein
MRPLANSFAQDFDRIHTRDIAPLNQVDHSDVLVAELDECDPRLICFETSGHVPLTQSGFFACFLQGSGEPVVTAWLPHTR